MANSESDNSGSQSNVSDSTSKLICQGLFWRDVELEGYMNIRVSHNTPFFELSYALLTSHAIGLEEATKKISAL